MYTRCSRICADQIAEGARACVFVVLFFNSFLLAARADETSKQLHISLDCAQFLGSDRRPYLEIYYSLPESRTQYALDQTGGYSCQIVMALQIFHEETLWASKLWKIEKTLKDTTAIDANLQMVDMLRYFLEKPGRYRVTLHAKDVNQQQIDSAAVAFAAHDFSAGQVGLSDIELASRIENLAPEATSIFAKNRMEVMPNPGLLYDTKASKLYYYFEAYRLFSGVSGSRYKTRCLIKDSDDKIVEGLLNPDRSKKKSFDSSVELGLIDVSTLASGIYSLHYGIADSAGHLLAGREKKFYIYNPGVIPQQSTQVAKPPAGGFGPLDLLSEAELDKEFELMQYGTTKDERKFFKNLQSIAAKREFLLSLWSQPRSGQELTGLAFRKQYLDRVEEANTAYRTSFRPGWKTDRGRVLILHGAPSSTERFANERETKPYEIWTYQHLEGGAIFIFADRYGFKNFELIHSTLRGELQNQNWQNLIRTDSNISAPTPRQ